MSSTDPIDYSKLIARHLRLAKELCVPTSDKWSEFFNLIDDYNFQGFKDSKDSKGLPKKGGWLSSLFEKRLQKECNSSVGDFYYFLYQYLTADNNYLLSSFIQKNTHFFSGYFKNVLKGAYKDFASLTSNHFKTISMDDDSNGNLHGSISDKNTADEDDFSSFSYLLHIWKKNQKDFFTILLRFVMHHGNAYTASLLGYRTDNAVSARIKHIKDKDVSFSADGANESVALDSWLRHDLYLSFAFPYRNVHGCIKVFLALPFDCTSPDDTYMRIECLQPNGEFLPEGDLFWGNLRCHISNGIGELLLRDFQIDIDKHKGGTVALCLADGTRLNGIPRLGNYAPVKHISDEKILKYRSQSKKNNLLPELIRDFGKGLVYLFNNKLEYSRYGGLRQLEYSLLSHAGGEAWIIFANAGRDTAGCLPEDGFIFPLEWRFHPEMEYPHSRLLSPTMIQLGEKIAGLLNASGWGLYPAYRFFYDRVDFSQLSVIGGSDEDFSSASLTLLTALVHAMNGKYKTPVPVFASAQMDFATNKLCGVGHLKEKLKIAQVWGASYFFIALEQLDEAKKIISENNINIKIVPVVNDSPLCMGSYTAYYFLHKLYTDDDELKNVFCEEFKVKRSGLVTEISAKANLQWDGENIGNKEYGSLTVLVGRPGMGKSILMHDLAERWKNHKVFCHVCRAGEKFPIQKFIKSIARQLAMYSEAIAVRILYEIQNGNIREDADEQELCRFYERFIIAPLRDIAVAKATKRHYLLIDGLDEDDSGMLVHLLSNPKYTYPKNFSLVVSTRGVEPIFSEIQNVATSVVDLSADKFDEVCEQDIEKFIINLIYSNEKIRRCWQNSSTFMDDDELREKIASKDKSFLYATYVLQGIADGQYHFDRLDQELPKGLTAFYNDSFRYRFSKNNSYENVRPLLTLLSRESKLKVQTAAEILKQDNCHEPIGKMIQALRGYCIADGDELALSDATLREWLLDPIKNPEFSVL